MVQASTDKNIDLGYRPRNWQWDAQKTLKGKRYGVFICSRQIGKTVAALAILCDRMLRGPAHSAGCYLSPAQSQARRIAWPGLKERLRPLGHLVKFSESQLVATLPGDRKIYLLGAENETVRGSSFHTVICDERDNISDEFWYEVMMPTTNAWQDKAFVLFIGTLSGGDSSLWRMYMEHRNDPDWSCVKVPAEESGVFKEEWLAQRRIELGETAYLREMQCDPRAPVKNSVLGAEMSAAADDKRITSLPYRAGYEVHTCWDLGIRDFTAVWGFQLVGRWIEVLFYREYAGLGMDSVLGKLVDEFKHYRWGEAMLPHDAKNRDKSYGTSVQDLFFDENLWPGTSTTQRSAPNPISTLRSARVNMPRCKFDEHNCDTGIMRLKSARYQVHPKTGTVLDTILHDDNSHCLDAWRLGMYVIESRIPASSTEDYAPWNPASDQVSHLPAAYFE